MRNLLAIVSVLALVGLAGITDGRAGTIVGSDHDLSTQTTTTADVCVFCHTPHNTADPAALPVALWNRTASTVTFTMYSSPTLDMVIATQPQGVSAACLSCHDGVTAFDSLVNKPGGLVLPDTMGTGKRAVGRGGNLTDDHPISITYNVGTGPGQDPQFHAATSGEVNGLPLFRAPGSTTADQVECASCHNPHEPDFGSFLRISNAGSAVCTSCHMK